MRLMISPIRPLLNQANGKPSVQSQVKDTGKIEQASTDQYESLARVLLKPVASRGGVLAVLRHGLAIGPARIWTSLAEHIRETIGVAVDRFYDWWHGVDTCGFIWAKHLDSSGESGRFSNEYGPTPAKTFRFMLDTLPGDPADYTFVDYGSGKGRTLFLAAERPFRKIIGIELAQSLVETAQQNIRSYRYGKMRCTDIETLAIDATEYDLPRDPCVIFMYSPFYGDVLERVFSHLAASYRAAPRPLIFVYLEEIDTDVIPHAQFESMGFLKRLDVPELPNDWSAPWPVEYAVYASPEALPGDGTQLTEN